MSSTVTDEFKEDVDLNELHKLFDLSKIDPIFLHYPFSSQLSSSSFNLDLTTSPVGEDFKFQWLFRLDSSFQEIQLDNNPRILKVQATMKSRPITCVIDTGASLNYIGDGIMESKWFGSWNLDIQPSNCLCTIGYDTQVLSLGKTTFPIQFDGETYPINAEIIPGLPFALVIGMQFLRQHQCIIDLGLNRLILRTNNEFILSLNESTTVPAYCQMFVSASSTYPNQNVPAFLVS